jgi:hypothetical protein
MKAQVMQGAAVLSAAAAVSLFQALPASAYTINGSSITIDNTSVGQFFEVEFDGNVETQPVPGLTSNAKFEIVSFSGTSAVFNINLTNTSSGGITSRTSVLGFDVNRTLTGASASGGFGRAILDSSLPNQFGAIDVCFKGGGGPNCQGGGGSGATAGNPIDFLATLNFGGPGVADFTLSNFGVRYQSVTGTSLGTSGTGQGTPIPTPALLPGLVGLGVAAVRKRRGQSGQDAA